MDDASSAPHDSGAGGNSTKRSVDVDVGGGGEEVRAKRRRTGDDAGVEMRRVAEIVLVLSALGRMRAGRDPTVTEKALMEEARRKVVALCQELAPKDILPAEAFGGVIEDLGLSRLKDRGVGFRTPKISISERIALSKRRMEESKAFAVPPASYPSQRVQTTSVATGENRGIPPTVRGFPSDKVGHVPVSTGTFPPPASVTNVSPAASMPMRIHLPSTEVRQPAVTPAVMNDIVRDSGPLIPPGFDRTPIRPEGKPNGHSISHVPATQHMMRTTPVQLRPQIPMPVNVGTKNMVLDLLPGRSDSNVSLSAPPMTSHPAVAQMPGLVVNQTTAGSLPTMHHPVQGMPFVHAPTINQHLEVSRLVQQLLTPKFPPRSVWTPPSRDYMNRAVPCQFCKLVINEVENMVVCDACEKGFHVGCLQSHNAKSIPRGEWHCPKCLSMSNGKLFPPKYGRVTRNMNVPKVISNTTGVQLPSDRKAGTVNEKVNQLNATIDRIQDSKLHIQLNQSNVTTNRSQDSKQLSQPVKVKPSSNSNLQPGSEIDRMDISINAQAGVKSENFPNNSTEAAAEASLPTSADSSSDKPSQKVKSEISPSEDGLVSVTETIVSVASQANNKFDDLLKSSNQSNVDPKVLDGVDIPVHQHSDRNGVIESHQYNDDDNDRKDAAQENLVEIARVHGLAEELAEASESSLHNVDWVGDIYKIVDEKKFFRSCHINGTVYQVQHYALHDSGKGKLRPLKLQAMWEDSQTSSKWLAVNKCYFPDDLPEEVGRPGAPQSNEVYESTHESRMLAGFVQGPCEVLPFRKFGEETERNNQCSPAKDSRQTVFIRNWFYDETRRAFCPNAS